MNTFFIRECPPRIKEDNKALYQNLGYFYDIETGIPVYQMKVDRELVVGKLYDFVVFLPGYQPQDVNRYLVLKRENDMYYMAEFLDGELFTIPEDYINLNGHLFEKCNVEELFDINLKAAEKCAQEIY